ncbi:MAG: Release factor glutamine methyltransferase [Friedmanniella sp.]|nr:Release factor glutamine methyltransferase [Friedmanniella sp.]
MTTSVRGLLLEAVSRLESAGVESPQQDARLLLAHVCDVEPARLPLLDHVRPDQQERFRAAVTARASRVPLQHLTGRAYFRYLELAVGPGVFVPRPETEVMTGWAIDHLRRMRTQGQRPLVVELCAGSGAIAKAIATEVPGVEVHAVELSVDAAEYAERNLRDTGVFLHIEDMAMALHELDGSVDLLIANPPYIPLEAYESVAPEARDHDPTVALFSGQDGLDAIRVVAQVGVRLLHPAGLLAVEHADVQGESAPAAVAQTLAYTGVRDNRDLTGRPRFVTAVRRSGW